MIPYFNNITEVILAFVPFQEATKVVQPLMLGGLIRYFVPGSGVTKFDAYMMALGLSLCAMMLAVSHHPYFYGVQRIGMRLRIAACGLIYKKVIKSTPPPPLPSERIFHS